MAKNLNLGFGINFPNPVDKKNSENKKNFEVIQHLSKTFDSIQIMFTKNTLSKDELKEIKEISSLFKYIFIHGSYQINIGSDLIPTQNDLYTVGVDILYNEIVMAIKIKAQGIVIHMGKNVKNKLDPDTVYNNMVIFIVEIFNKLKNNKLNFNILIETVAGQGGEMCSDLNDFVNFIIRFENQEFYENLGVVIDTCHIFQAGYDLNNEKELKKVHEIFAPIKNKIKLIHLNDSYHEVGKKIDRHEQLGKGKIDINSIIKFILPYKHVPMILETSPPYEKQVSLLEKKL